MTNEEMQQTMQFIIEQQAQFVENFQRIENSIRALEESQTKSDARISRLEGAIIGIVNVLDRITIAQEELAEAQKRTDAKVSKLIEAQAQTDERLNALINTVERYISEGRNGKPPKQA